MTSPPLRPARAALVLLALAAAAPAGRAQALPAEQLKAVKDASVLVRVTLPNGDKVTGSGFFAHAPGLVVTNAHVLGMLDPDSRRPLQVEVVARSGEPDARTIPAAVLGVDRGSDLGVVRVDGKGLPAPLPLASADGLAETDEVYAFGFPFGDRLGKNITVAKTSVSSLRKTAGGALDKVQVNGGIHPGNSGGPVTDAKGRVVGVAVSGLRNTQIHFAIPADRVTRYLAGRLVATNQELPYRDGGVVRREYRAELLDPLGRIQKVAVECFTAPDGPPRRAGDAPLPPQPGDSPVKTYALKYDPKAGVATGEIEVPPLPTPTHRYYVRPVVTDGEGKTRWYGTSPEGPKYILDRVPLTLTYRPAAGPVPGEVVSIGAFRLRTPDDQEFATGLNLKARFAERPAPADGKGAFPVRLTPTGFSASVTRDGKALPTDADLQGFVRDTRFFAADVVRDEEGGWVRARADVARVPAATRGGVEDLGFQLLQSLEAAAMPLPNREVKPLETWKSRREVVVGASSLDMTILGVADYRYKYLGTTERGGKTVAFVRVSGTIRGRVGAGVDVGGTIDGRADIDPATGETVYSELTLKADADLPLRTGTLKAMGTLTIQARRGDLPPLAPPPPKK